MEANDAEAAATPELPAVPFAAIVLLASASMVKGRRGICFARLRTLVMSKKFGGVFKHADKGRSHITVAPLALAYRNQRRWSHLHPIALRRIIGGDCKVPDPRSHYI